ncbi:hypothetical protein C8A00DRAFT_30066 [Chaetomidium leptoderma]|uniref:F-box domain-containing protein n=1 Tax=Chaetomidium leptoderma TaxID=669021 RepID=A0AAN6VVS1_9PEZI|nr:hypothetical protein C8A00DRAFT_30066 [Chaetomidium leptoderma]
MSPPNALLAQIPVQLLLNIAEHNHTSRVRDLNALAQTCRSFYGTLHPMLYFLNVQYEGASAALWAARHGRIDQLEILRGLGADLENVRDNSEDGWSFAVMSTAAAHGQDATLAWFLARTPPYVMARHQLMLNRALLQAVDFGRVSTCDILVGHGASYHYDMAQVRRALVEGRVDVAKALAVCTPPERMAGLLQELKAVKASMEEEEDAGSGEEVVEEVVVEEVVVEEVVVEEQ